MVRCSNQNLTHIPRDIPAETTELYLDNNAIEQLYEQDTAALAQVPRLERLDLTYNRLVALPAAAFAKNTLLSTLYACDFLIFFLKIHQRARGVHFFVFLLKFSEAKITSQYIFCDREQ